jgi:hypothetical protein
MLACSDHSHVRQLPFPRTGIHRRRGVLTGCRQATRRSAWCRASVLGVSLARECGQAITLIPDSARAKLRVGPNVHLLSRNSMCNSHALHCTRSIMALQSLMNRVIDKHHTCRTAWCMQWFNYQTADATDSVECVVGLTRTPPEATPSRNSQRLNVRATNPRRLLPRCRRRRCYTREIVMIM